MTLFSSLAAQIIAGRVTEAGDRHLVSYKSDKEFVQAVKQARAGLRLHAEVAAEFHIHDDYVETLISNHSLAVVYPDSCSKFSDGSTVIAEHKLSGDNDSKAVTKNLEVLAVLKPHFEFPGTAVKTAIALPFTDVSGSRASRWKQHSQKPDVVACNSEAFKQLLGCPMTEADYDQLVELMASSAATAIVNVAAVQ
jgi:hypothetical protein